MKEGSSTTGLQESEQIAFSHPIRIFNFLPHGASHQTGVIRFEMTIALGLLFLPLCSDGYRTGITSITPSGFGVRLGIPVLRQSDHASGCVNIAIHF